MNDISRNRTVAQYLLLESVGAGGMGEVFRARDTRLGRTVALKMLPAGFAGDPERRARFMQEARAAAALSHPGIAILFEAGEADGRLFLAFEFVPGETLRHAVADGPVHPRRAAAIAIQIADALAEAHGAGIIHRDIKPDNIVITPKGSAKVLDFGLASWTEGGLSRTLAPTHFATDPSVVMGTVAYMSPEQATAQPLDGRTDVFSLGVVLYEMLTGRNPFLAPTAAATLVNIMQVPPPAPSSLNPQVTPELDAIVLRAVAPDIRQRYQSAAALASDLRQVHGERTEHVFERDLPERASHGARRLSRGAIALLAAVVVIAAAAGLAYPRRADLARWWKHALGPTPAPIVAVIPLDVIGKEESWFADGFTGDMIMRLGQTPGLRVLGRSATRSYRGRAPSDVARELGAAVVLTGSVQREAGEVKINLELVDPRDGVQVWRQRFVRPAEDILKLQSEIADAVAEALHVELVGSAARTRTASRTVSPDAYEDYVRARAVAASRRNPEQAIALYEAAIAKDPGLAEAYAGLASVRYHRAVFAGHGLEPQEEARIRDAANHAFAIEPDLSEVEIALGLTEPSLRDALRRLVRAVTLDPSNPDAYHEIGDQIVGAAPERGAEMFERSRSLDRLMFANYPDLTIVHLQAGRVEEARRTVAEARRLFPDHPFAVSLESAILEHTGDLDGAIAVGRKLAEVGALPSPGWARIARLQHQGGQRQEAVRTLREALEQFPGDCEVRATLAGMLIDRGDRSGGRAVLDAQTRPFPASCAAVRAAAVADAPGTAAALRRIAEDEPELRAWLILQFGTSRVQTFTQRAYPWNKVASAAPVIEAEQRVHAARDRLKAVIDEELRVLAGD